jgi:hypothetical protein
LSNFLKVSGRQHIQDSQVCLLLFFRFQLMIMYGFIRNFNGFTVLDSYECISVEEKGVGLSELEETTMY